MKSLSLFKIKLPLTINSGVLVILVGIGALAQPLVSIIPVISYFGWTFLLFSAIQLIHTLNSQVYDRFIFELAISFLYLISALILFIDPLNSTILITLVLGTTILSQSLLQTVMAIELKPKTGWVALLISGISGVVFSCAILTHWPIHALWAIGLFVGINFIVDGCCVVASSSRDKERHKCNE